ncbi:E3 ubiquitin-protein ligase RGLG4-like isoform X2 [Durio zibethinus]|uniref:E3 ubiquitin-protein ligase RGLG4-like isoform X2 n=1 Tax=Durio zibethinus TaxID=66656 RepID=A0A6P5Y0T9_DURZI|nr:E3 ubiquitin-protein ligase RGLG4-like isoform X2 [Durio zibethinus]
MGNFLSQQKRKQLVGRNRSSGNSSRGRSVNRSFPPAMSEPQASSSEGGSNASTEQISNNNKVSTIQRKLSAKQKYGFIRDNFSTLDQVTKALRDSGLESSNLIVGIDFTKSNEWAGKVSFDNRSLHAIGDRQNPYEKAISIIGKTLAPFDEDNLIPCFGFGDGPTSYAPVIDTAIDIVENSGGQFHVLLIIADGQVTRSVNTGDIELSPQEEKTINSIVTASSHPLSIVLVGVGDGPWDDMKKFDDKIPTRDFDNFQFVNFTEIMSKNKTPEEKEALFALAALMEIPLQYKAVMELGLLGQRTGKAKKVVPRPPPVPYSRPAQPERIPSNVPSSPALDDRTQACPICLTNGKDLAFGCGHMTCRECGSRVSNCPICRQRITNRLRLFA